MSFAKLASASKSLNEASDALSKQINQVETALNELKLGIWAWVQVAKFAEDRDAQGSGLAPLTRVEMLGYGKLQGKWGLLFNVSYEEIPDPELETTWFLREAPRMERLKAVDQLPTLIQALETKATEITNEATKKAAQVKELASALRKIAGGA